MLLRNDINDRSNKISINCKSLGDIVEQSLTALMAANVTNWGSVAALVE